MELPLEQGEHTLRPSSAARPSFMLDLLTVDRCRVDVGLPSSSIAALIPPPTVVAGTGTESGLEEEISLFLPLNTKIIYFFRMYRYFLNLGTKHDSMI